MNRKELLEKIDELEKDLTKRLEGIVDEYGVIAALLPSCRSRLSIPLLITSSRHLLLHLLHSFIKLITIFYYSLLLHSSLP